MKWIVLVSAAIVILAAAAFLIGGAVQDDAERVASLEQEVEELVAARDRETERAQSLADQLDAQDEELAQLELDLARAQEQAPAPPVEETSGALTGLQTHRMGEGANVGQMRIIPKTFERLFTSGGVATYHAVVSVRNNASTSIAPFCGDSGAELVDAKGRTFDPESVIDDTSNNCEDVQPGLTMDNFKVAFKVPASARPRVLRLWGDYDNDAVPEAWRVKE